MIVDDGGDATLLIHRGYEAENDAKVLDDDEGSEELACVNKVRLLLLLLCLYILLLLNMIYNM